jgi:hypothetical protein
MRHTLDKKAHTIPVGNLKGRRHFEDTSLDRIILIFVTGDV